MTRMTGLVDAPTAAPPLPLSAIPAPPEPDAIRLGTGGIGDAPPESWLMLNGQESVRNVATATLTPVLPAPGTANGTAVIVAPGGGFVIESMANEAWPQARWLADRGIAAFILKYRLDPTPESLDDFRAAMLKRFAAAVVPLDGRRSLPTPANAVADGQAAVRLVRSRATEWGVDPARVGWLGFSAGAMTGLGVVAAGAAGAVPDFLATIYPSMDPMPVADDAPPLFVAIAGDDQLFGLQGYGLAEGWRRAGRSVELHVYEQGGHGFGMGRPGTTSEGWIESLGGWMATRGLLDRRD